MKLRKKVLSRWRPDGDSDFWFDMVVGGNLKPSQFLSGQELIDVNAAIEVLISFEIAIHNLHERESYGQSNN